MYIETTTTAVSAGLLGDMPRLDYSGGATCPSLLLEPSRTNAISSSEYLDGSNMVKTTIADTYNTSDTLSPEGVYNAVKLQGTGTYPRFAYGTTIADNTDVTISVFAKVGTAQVFTMRIFDKSSSAAVVNFDLQNGTASISQYSSLTPSYDIEPMGNDWYRCWVSANSGTGASGFEVRPLSHAVGESNAWTNGNYIYAYGVQMESSASYPTSYIPTYGSASLRGADYNVLGSASSIIGQTEGTAYVEFNIDRTMDGTARIVTISNGGGSERIGISLSTSIIYAFIVDGGVTQAEITENTSPSGNYKVALAYANNDVVFYINGVQIGTDTAATMPTTNEIELGNQFGAAELGGGIKQALLFKSRLTNAELASLTTL